MYLLVITGKVRIRWVEIKGLTNKNKIMETKGIFVVAISLDSRQPYSLGNRKYLFHRECNSGHKDLRDDEIGFAGGYYDGYNWAVPVCKRCVSDGKTGFHSHNTSVHLKEFMPLDEFSINNHNLLVDFLKYCRSKGQTWILEHEINELVDNYLS